MRNSTQSYTIPSAFAGTYKNAYTGASVTLTSGATQSLTAFQYIVLTNQNVATVAVTGVTLSPTTASVAVGSTQQLTPTIAPANATNQAVTYTSSNTAVATVGVSGIVTAIAPGTATITVTTADGGKTATCVVTAATVAVTGVTLSPTTATITAGGTQQLTPTIAPANASNKAVTYTSSNTAVATVSAAGLVTAVAAGTATITVKTTDGSKTATSTITVNPVTTFTVYFLPPTGWGTGIKIYWWDAMPTGILADGTWPGVSMSGPVNGWYSYTFTNVTSTNLIFNDGSNQTANLSRGTTGWYENGTWYDTNPGTPISVTGVTVSPTTATLITGATQQVTATIAPANATNTAVTWASSNTAVATVSTTGLVTAVAAGTATITVTTADGSKTATCSVTVNAANVAVTGVTLSPTTASLTAGATQQLTATIAPANATNKTVTYTSSNTAIATVSTAGLVTAVAAGTATITVTTQDGSKIATAAITVTAASGFTVYFYPPTGWGTGIKIYWWDALPTGILADGTWPGVTMSGPVNGWYSYTFTNITSTNLIFNDGSNQTANLNRGSTGWYLNGTWYNTNPGTPVAVTGVTVSPTTASIVVGATQQVTATIAPSNATNTAVTWSSSNTAVATVNTTGLVTAVAAGIATITVTTADGSKTATCAVTVTAAGASTTYYNILNRWQANTYLYDGGNGQVKYGTSPSGNNNYEWAQVDAGGGFFYLKNLGTGNLMNVEDQNGAVEANTANTTWYSAMWTFDSTGDGWDYIENRWQTAQWINIEGLVGYAQYANAQTGWYSAMWQFVNPTSVPGGLTSAYVSGIVENPATRMAQNGDPFVHPALSPNGDGINDVLTIDNITKYPENKIMIMNSNGVKVFEAAGYDNMNKTFNGHSNITGALMPRGTYFYELQYKASGKLMNKTGYIVLKY